MTTALKTPGVLQERDLEIAQWLSRVVVASVGQIQMRFGLGRTQTYRRLQVLRDFGVVRRHYLSVTMPPVYSVGGGRLRLATCSHALAVTELAVAVETAGGEIATELELRRARGGQRTLLSPLSETQIETVRDCRRVPDAAQVLASGGLRAYEVELSSKGRSRRLGVLRAYARSTYQQVTWLAPDRQLAALVAREIEELGLSRLMEVASEIE